MPCSQIRGTQLKSPQSAGYCSTERGHPLPRYRDTGLPHLDYVAPLLRCQYFPLPPETVNPDRTESFPDRSGHMQAVKAFDVIAASAFQVAAHDCSDQWASAAMHASENLFLRTLKIEAYGRIRRDRRSATAKPCRSHRRENGFATFRRLNHKQENAHPPGGRDHLLHQPMNQLGFIRK